MLVNYDNYEIAQFEGCNSLGIPALQPQEYTDCDWIGFNYCLSTKLRSDKGVHFFLDDYQFDRVWNKPRQYAGLLSQFKYVMTPDFSMYTDFPLSLQIYNHYRKQWLGAYWQSLGIKVIPTISWSLEESYLFAFDGIPKHSVIAVSSVGTQNSKLTKALFEQGYNEMYDRLEPSKILFYGKVPDWCRGNIVKLGAFQDKFSKIRS